MFFQLELDLQLEPKTRGQFYLLHEHLLYSSHYEMHQLHTIIFLTQDGVIPAEFYLEHGHLLNRQFHPDHKLQLLDLLMLFVVIPEKFCLLPSPLRLISSELLVGHQPVGIFQR